MGVGRLFPQERRHQARHTSDFYFDYVAYGFVFGVATGDRFLAFWEDLNFRGVQRAYAYNDGSRLIIEYKDVPGTSGGGPYTFETILYPSGAIVFQFRSRTATYTRRSTSQSPSRT